MILNDGRVPYVFFFAFSEAMNFGSFRNRMEGTGEKLRLVGGGGGGERHRRERKVLIVC